MLAVTTNNASNNNAFILEFERICEERQVQFDYSENHVHCLAHVINLAAQAVMRSLKATTDQTEDQIATDDDDDVGEIVPKV